MSRDGSQRVSTSIHRKLSSLLDTSNEQCIFKVDDRLRSQNKKAYEPEMLSIGPYHHGKSNLKNMEMHKLRYMRELLLRRGESSAERYVVALTQLEERARRCYAEEISLTGDEFLEMMCLDGCFLIEIIRKSQKPELHNSDYDPIFQMGWIGQCIARDLILFENQLPFFILIQLFDMTKFPGEDENIIDLAILPLHMFFPGYVIRENSTTISADSVIHLLDLIHKSWCSSFASTLGEIQNTEDNIFPLKFMKPECNNLSLEFIKSAIELGQGGIIFKKAEQSKSWLDITFENGVMKIPPLVVDDLTETVFRNLIAYEEYMFKPYEKWRCVSDYAMLMNRLVDSSKDVEKLRHRQIIMNWLGDDEAISTLFNNIDTFVFADPYKFSYSGVFEEVNKYSSRRRNIWRAHLMRNYFNTPWSIISFLAAVMMILLTFIQTLFCIVMRNYFNTPWSIISFLAAVLLLLPNFIQILFSILQYRKQ